MQKKITTRIIKSCVLLAGFIFLFLLFQDILRHKCYWLFNDTPETEMWETFYETEKDSVDVLFFGSSHVYNSINPVVFYEETGLTGFDMASSNQDLFTAYYYLKEALKYQSPKYVVIETFGMFERPFVVPDYDKALYYKITLDEMRLSWDKIEALLEWKKNINETRLIERFFPMFEYHSRWDELSEVDFDDTDYMYNLNGYCISYNTGDFEYKGYDVPDDRVKFPELVTDYFDKIYKLCEENGIKVFMLTVPDSKYESGRHISTEELAGNYGISYIDYNSTDLVLSLNLNNEMYWKDLSHLNDYGSEKLTRDYARFLVEEGCIDMVECDKPEWNEKILKWRQYAANERLCRIWDFDEYLDTLLVSDYQVFIAACDEPAAGLSDEQKLKLTELTGEVSFENFWRNSFVASSGPIEKVSQKSADSVLMLQGVMPDKTKYSIESAGYDAGAAVNKEPWASVRIDNHEYAINERGLNFVVYDMVTGKVADSICFDTYSQGAEATRND